MYQVYANDKLLHQPGDDTCALTDATLSLAVNKSGSFEATLACSHPLYKSLREMSTTIRIEQDGEPLFYGRIISVQKDFQGNKHISCEGELAYLLDSVQPPHEFHDISVRAFLEHLIAEHNKQVGTNGTQFKVGQVTVTDPNDSLYRYTNWETTLDAITDKLTERLGGFIRTRHVGSVRYLDYLEDYGHTSNQLIEFGENLLDYSENLDATELATRIIPLGAKKETSSIQALDEHVTIESVNAGKTYVESTSAQKLYGVITKTVTFDDVTLPENLKRKAQQYLADTQFATLSLMLNAVDLHLLDKTIEAFRLGDSIRVISAPHGMDRRFTLMALTLKLDDPAGSTITLGDKQRASFTERSVSANQDIIKRIDTLPSQSETLRLAKDNATALITAQTTGNVVTRANEILIMDTKDTSSAKKVWRWNMAGLGYSKTGYKGTYGTAITMNGAIVADYITAGTLNADLIRVGTLKDKQGNVSWNLATGALDAKNLSITSPNFTLTRTGYLTAKSANLTGSLTTETDTTKLRVGYGYMAIDYNDKEIGLVGGNGFAGSDTIAGLNFNLKNTGDYMSWSAQPASGGNFTMIWTYARSRFGNFSAGCLNAGCDIDMHGHALKNVRFDVGGITGTCNFVKINSMSSDGTVSNWSNNCKMVFKNGILISGTF
ncbi:phage tail spike protein [Alloscardovia omnicolens]|uniref:phage tail spike protein n=1 Tax=Alloscardovia omnicolens TaxID=419015 RepID=UPI003A62609F